MHRKSTTILFAVHIRCVVMQNHPSNVRLLMHYKVCVVYSHVKYIRKVRHTDVSFNVLQKHHIVNPVAVIIGSASKCIYILNQRTSIIHHLKTMLYTQTKSLYNGYSQNISQDTTPGCHGITIILINERPHIVFIGRRLWMFHLLIRCGRTSKTTYIYRKPTLTPLKATRSIYI